MENKWKMENDRWNFQHGFTLVELLIVITILGIIVTIGLVSFRSSQIRGRDTQRKSDLKQIASALELYYSDYGSYPTDSGGLILACPPVSDPPTPCTWGDKEKQFTDNKTIYMKFVPKDPSSNQKYFYRTVSVDSIPYSGFQLFVLLENTQDTAIISTNYSCGAAGNCNFAVTSPNTNPTE